MPLQSEYRDLAGEYTEAAKRILGDNLVAVCYFGSAARGEALPESDLDVLVVATGLPSDLAGRVRLASTIREQTRRSEVAQRMLHTGRSTLISSIYMTPDEAKTHPPILLDISDHGVIEYDREAFLEIVLANIRIRLGELGAKKIRAKKGYYWVLKPAKKPEEVIEI